MSNQEEAHEDAVPLIEDYTMADGPIDNRAGGKESEVESLETQQTYPMILASNRLDANHISPPKRLDELSFSTNPSQPCHLFSLPLEIRLMIYHFAIGNHYLHIYSNCDTIPGRIIQCDDEDLHICLKSRLNLDLLGFPFDYRPAGGKPVSDIVVHCQGSVLFHNRICTSQDINIGDRNGYWSLSLSHEVQTGLQTVQHGTRDNATSANAKLLDHCPCIHHTKTSLNLSLLQTSKRINEEAALIPYESNTFIFQEMETFAAFFGLVFPKKSDSNDSPNFPSHRSKAINNMRNIRLHSRIVTSQHLYEVSRLLRASLSILAGLHTFELTLGLMPIKKTMWEIDDSLFAVSPSVKKVTVNIRDYIWLARDFETLKEVSRHNFGTWKTSTEEKQEFAAKLIERILKKDGFSNKGVLFFETGVKGIIWPSY